MVAAPLSVEIFCSYAHADEGWRKKLETHLSLLRRQGLVSLWHNRLITAGIDWAKTIDTHLETASIILLLVSADFFASDYCSGIEMKRALERQEAGEAYVIPLLIRPVDWTGAPFAHLQTLPTNARPLSTWQDKDAAFTEVVAGIRRVLEDLPLLAARAPRAALPAILNIPYPRNPFFLGRESELAQVRQRLQAGQTMALSQPQAISGLGGVGKTQMALEYAYRHRYDYQAILWCRAETRDDLINDFLAIARLLRLPKKEDDEQLVVVREVISWFQTHERWLLILDNADDLSLVQEFIPLGGTGHVLLTTRMASMGRVAHRLEVEILEPDVGACFVLRRAGIIAIDAPLEQAASYEKNQAQELVQEMGGLPLALDQAGAYIEEVQCSISDYLYLYRIRRAALLKMRGGVVLDHPAAVATTWSLSFAKIEQANPVAADLLRVCAFLQPDAIPEEIIVQGASRLGSHLQSLSDDSLAFNRAIQTLRSYSLIRRTPDTHLVSVHRLVQAVLKDTMDDLTYRQWAERIVEAIEVVLPAPDAEHGAWKQYERCLVHALGCVSLIEDLQLISSSAAQLLHLVSIYLIDHARFGDAESLCKRASNIWEQALGSEHPWVAYPLHGLATLYKKQGRHEKAEPLYKQALRIWEQTLGIEHSLTAYAHHGLANLYYEQGRYREAEPLYKQALWIKEREWDPEHPNVASPLTDLATLYREQGKYAQAEPLLKRALQIREQALGPEHTSVAYSLHGLAELYINQERYAEAEQLYKQSLGIWEQTLEPEHSMLAWPLRGLANLYYRQGKYEKAESFAQRALYIREQALGPEHHLVAWPLTDFGNIYSVQGRYKEAEPLYRRAIRIREQALGSEHPFVAYALYGLANLYKAQRKYAEAESLYQRALRIYEQAHGSEHLLSVWGINDLANLYYEQGKYEEAEPLYKRALHIREQALGPGYSGLAYPLHGLANLYKAQGKYAEAQPLYQRTLHIYEQTLGLEHSRTQRVREDYLSLLRILGFEEEPIVLEMKHQPPS